MSKLYLEVQAPGNAKTYEFRTDNSMTVGAVKRAFIRQISELENHALFEDPSQVLFCSRQLEGLLQDDETLVEVGVKSGDTIILL